MASDKDLYQQAKARVLAAAAEKRSSHAKVSLCNGKAEIYLTSYASGTVIWEMSVQGRRYKAPGTQRTLDALEVMLQVVGIDVR